MDAVQIIGRIEEFLSGELYRRKILKAVTKGKNFLVVDFADLVKFDHELAEILLEDPEETIKAAELAVENFDFPAEARNFRIRFSNLPESQHVLIKDIRAEHIGKFLTFDGLVRQKSDVRPQVTSVRFECPACGNIIPVLQLEQQFREPSRCSCGRKGNFRIISKALVDAQMIVLEEVLELLEGGEQPKRMNIFLKEDLVSPLTEKYTNPGSKIRVTGIVKEVQKVLRTGTKSTTYDLLIESNYVVPLEEDYYETTISPEEELQIKELSQNPRVYELLIASVAPSIFGYDEIKEALLLQLMGSVRKERSDKMSTRGDLHILLVGDPGSGKSQLLKRISQVSPKGRYIGGGRGVSAAGLTAAVVRDEFLGGWSLEAGALVLTNNGLCCIDEIDKMTVEDRNAMHEALEQQTVSISKANVHATLNARTSVLAAANPKFGRFDPFSTVAEQIDMPPTLINRFDLIFPIKDLPDEIKDERAARHILRLHQSPDVIETDISTAFLKKYIAYARQNIRPEITDGALLEIKDFYVQMRNQQLQDERVARTIPISPRQLEALVRLSEASAKIRLADKVTRKDSRRAIKLLTYCLSQIGRDPITGAIDIDRITTGIPASQRDRIFTVRDIINELEQSIGKIIPIDAIQKEAVNRGMKEEDVEEVIERLKRTGDLYEPRRDHISRV